jgi:short-subunit dehydrogenase
MLPQESNHSLQAYNIRLGEIARPGVSHMETVLITGASRGIGRTTALLAAVRGWPVAINYRNDAAAAAEVASEVRGKGSRATTVRGDVSVEAEVVGMSILDVAGGR